MKEVWIVGRYEDILKIFSSAGKAYDYYDFQRSLYSTSIWIKRYEVE